MVMILYIKVSIFSSYIFILVQYHLVMSANENYFPLKKKNTTLKMMVASLWGKKDKLCSQNRLPTEILKVLFV